MSDSDMVNVQCETCGVYIRLDGLSVQIKKSLRKPVECPICRNSRIAREIEATDADFAGDIVEDSEPKARAFKRAANQTVF
jgi:endogenous inhibitor of DNA gyrase (YacG/DUF329 family)